MTNFFKEAEAFFTIAKEIKPCITAFKTQNYESNPTKIIDLAVIISKKLEADYGLKGNALEYLKSFVKDSIQSFNIVSVDVKGNEYTKTLGDLVGNAKKLINEQATLISAIMEDVNDAKSSTAVKQFKTDKVEAGIDLFENIISAICSTVEGVEQPKEEL
ncbi:MAG: hypothetical protein K2P53_06175 [Rickettsiales bacterium]|jgi:hypothetical protein|nr:hypothetical protein [Rickettsiales bacterium]